MLVLGCLLIVACGGTKAVSPTTVTTAESSLTLNSGPYTLTLSQASGPVCVNGICQSVLACVNAGGPGSSSDAIAMTVQRDGDTARVAAASGDSLRLALQISGTSVTGTVSGGTTGSSGLPVTASGTISGGPGGLPNGASGALNGQLTIGSASCSSTGHTWRLVPR